MSEIVSKEMKQLLVLTSLSNNDDEILNFINHNYVRGNKFSQELMQNLEYELETSSTPLMHNNTVILDPYSKGYYKNLDAEYYFLNFSVSNFLKDTLTVRLCCCRKSVFTSALYIVTLSSKNRISKIFFIDRFMQDPYIENSNFLNDIIRKFELPDDIILKCIEFTGGYRCNLNKKDNEYYIDNQL